MRYLILLAAFAATSAHAEERWAHIANVEVGSYSIDTRTAKHTGNGATFWSKSETADGQIKVLQFTEIDCATRRFRITLARSFVRGEYVSDFDKEGVKPWTPIAPETVIEGVADAICLENLE